MTSSIHYLVATVRPWNIRAFESTIKHFPGEWHLVSEPKELTEDLVRDVEPRYIFFPHWNKVVPAEILALAECVSFHETQLPFGRGGSPIQNLIATGYTETSICALRMVEELDAGPIYLMRPLSLLGLGEEVFIRASQIVAEMIRHIVTHEPKPSAQQGDPTWFKRRTPGQSRIEADTQSLDELFDHIRMLDAAAYPRAYLDYGAFRFHFSRPARRTGRIDADVRITRCDSDDETETP